VTVNVVCESAKEKQRLSQNLTPSTWLQTEAPTLTPTHNWIALALLALALWRHLTTHMLICEDNVETALK